MKSLSKIVWVIGLVVSSLISAFAQEALWIELSMKVGKLYQQGRYREVRRTRLGNTRKI
ncbi:MAG: hypothetical protein L6Q94_17885 [Calditrichia bacterium]|nr:hypothetical protein [Calditrichia bacterium]